MAARRSPSSTPPPGSTPAVGFAPSPPPIGFGAAENRLIFISFDEGHCIARYGMIVICVWRKAPTMKNLDLVRRAAEDVLAEHPSGIGNLGVAEQGMPFMGAAERQASSKMFSDFAGTTRFSAMAIEGDGFWSSSAHSVVTAISVVARVPFPVRTFRYVSDAAAWQARFPGTPPALVLTEAAERCRAKLGPR